MGWLSNLFNDERNEVSSVSSYKMVVDSGDSFFSYNGRLYESDIVRSAIRPKAQAVGKAVGKHIRESDGNTTVNPDVYLRFLLEEPNEIMTGQMLLEKLTTQLMLNNNAFALIQRDSNGLANAIYPLDGANNVEALQDKSNQLYLRFTLDGKVYTFRYSDIIHLRRDFYDNKIFGSNPGKALTSLMEVVTTTDQGTIKAIKNSNIIRWLLKFNQNLRSEDIEKHTKQFVDSFLSTESETTGAAGTDAKTEAIQINPSNYVPDSKQTEGTIKRIYGFFNTNEKIIQSIYNEDEWISYFEAEIEPVITQLSAEFTRKLFSRRERGFGNRIIFESSNLSFASMQTRLGLISLVDRGVLSPNEMRKYLNLAPIENGDVYLRRLDTTTIGSNGDSEGGDVNADNNERRDRE
ncbi:phage portal protein [Aerococcus sp. L_4]